MNHPRTVYSILMIALGTFLPVPSPACTCFYLGNDQEKTVGKNYDWDISDGLIVVNKRDFCKSFDIVPSDSSAYWTSAYGSVTFNQYGRDLPQGGINEAGLVIEILWLNGTEYPPEDEREALGCTQWIQYQLDTSGSVADVIESFDSVRIQSQTSIHFLVADSSGETATIEFIGGKLVCSTGDSMPAKTLTNSTYEDSERYLRTHQGWGGTNPVPVTDSSLDRFVRASSLAQAFETSAEVSAIDYTFDVLDNVASEDYTQWSIVYDLIDSRVYFRTSSNREIRFVDLDELDFSCHSEVRIADIDAVAKGGNLIKSMIPYTRSANRDLIGRSYKATSFLSSSPDEVLDLVAAYPDHSTCTE